MTEQEFLSVFADAVEADISTLDMDTEFRYLDGWSSLSGFVFLTRMKEEFGKQIAISDFKAAETLRDVFNLFCAG